MFVSIELVLQTSRIFLLRVSGTPYLSHEKTKTDSSSCLRARQNRPAAPGILNSILPLVSQFAPQLGLVLQTGTRYLALFSTCLNDLAVLVFCIGLVILVGQFKAGSQEGSLQVLQDATKSILEKAKGDL
jgi:hypothetical protein